MSKNNDTIHISKLTYLPGSRNLSYKAEGEHRRGRSTIRWPSFIKAAHFEITYGSKRANIHKSK